MSCDPPEPTKDMRTIRAELKALAKFATALDAMDATGRVAAVRWIVSKYADSTYGIFIGGDNYGPR